MKRLILNKKQLFEVSTYKADEFNKDLSKIKNLSHGDYINYTPTADSDGVYDEYGNQQVNMAPVKTITGTPQDLQTQMDNNPDERFQGVVAESYIKKDVEQMRLNEIKRNGITLTKRELNEFLNS